MTDDRDRKTPPMPLAKLQDRDVYVPKTPPRGVPSLSDTGPAAWHEETTGVHTDVQVFRAVKGLHEELQASKIESTRAYEELKQDLGEMRAELGENTRATERVLGRVDVLMQERRTHSPSSQQRTVTVAVKETLADRVLSEHAQRVDFKHKAWLQIFGGLFSGATIAAIIAFVATRHC